MANRSVSVWKSVKVGDRWKYCRPVIGKIRKFGPIGSTSTGTRSTIPRATTTRIGARARSRSDESRVRPRRRLRAADFEEAKLRAIAAGVPVKNEAIPLMVSHTLHGYLEEYRLSQRPESYALMKQTLEEFVSLTGKNLIDRITRLDLLKYKEWLIGRGRSTRTAGEQDVEGESISESRSGTRTG